LKSADSSVPAEDRGYTYDTAWNLNYRTNNGSLSTFIVDNKNELTNAFGNPDSYDGNGNLVAANGSHNEYVYDDENQLIQWFNYQLSSISRSTGDKRTDFVYDGLGRLRVRVEYVLACQVSTNGGGGGGGDSLVGGGAQTQSQQDNCTWNVTNEVHYVYDGMRVIQERNGSNTPTCAYTRGSDLSGSLEGAGGIGGLLARTKYVAGSPTSFALYFSDGNGNVTSLIDTNQSVLASYRYDPFGNIISKSGTLADANVYRFSSKEVHVNSGMYYYGFRFYDPNLQRWMNRDPLEEEGGINLYDYVSNNPMNWVDGFGLAIIYNDTGKPIIVSGGAGPGEGHNPGNEVFVVVPPGATCGGAGNAMPGYASRAEALAAYRDPKSARSTGMLYDVDYFDNRRGPHDPNHGDNKIYGDDKGPHYNIYNVATRNHLGPGSDYGASSDLTDWPFAAARWLGDQGLGRQLQNGLGKCTMPWWP